MLRMFIAEALAEDFAGVAGSGLRVHLPAAQVGIIGVTDINDSFAENALSGLAVGDFVRCKVLASSGERFPAVCLSSWVLQYPMPHIPN